MVFHFSRKRDIVLSPPFRAANKTGERQTGRKSTKVKTGLSDGERERLERVAGNPRSLRKHAWRARIVLELGSGHGLMETARRTGMSKQAVWRWWDRFLAEGVDGLLRDATRPPGKKPIEKDRVKAAIDLAMSPPGIIGEEGTPGTGRFGLWRTRRGWPWAPCTAS